MATRKEYDKQRERRFQKLPEEPSCRVCGESDITKLVKNSKKIYGVIGFCRTCQRKYNVDRNQKHWFVIYTIKDKGCAICGEKGREILDFHHIGDKEFHPTQYVSSSTERLFDELSKCICVCANCHRRLHAGTINTDETPPTLSKLYEIMEEY